MPAGEQFNKRPLCKRTTDSILLLLFTNLLFISVIMIPLNVHAADDIRIAGELNYLSSNIETTNNDTGDVTGSDFVSFDQNYTVNVSREIYPFLTLHGGGSFELDDSKSTSDEIDTERTATNIRPFISRLKWFLCNNID